MREVLADFFLADDRARWRAILWSWLAGTAAGAVLSATKATIETLAWTSVTLSISTFGVFLLLRFASSRAAKPAVVESRRTFTQYGYALTATILFALLHRLFESPEAVHAAANEELASALRSPSGTSRAKILAIGSRACNLLEKNQAQGPTRSQLISDYAKMKAAAELAALPPVQPTHGGLRYIKPMPGVPFMNITGDNIAFIGPSFTTEVPGALFASVSPGRRVLIANSTISEFTVDLATIVWINVVFEKCAVTYFGGELTLVNVSFRNCTFRLREDVEIALLQRVDASSGHQITLTSDFIS